MTMLLPFGTGPGDVAGGVNWVSGARACATAALDALTKLLPPAAEFTAAVVEEELFDPLDPLDPQADTANTIKSPTSAPAALALPRLDQHAGM